MNLDNAAANYSTFETVYTCIPYETCTRYCQCFDDPAKDTETEKPPEKEMKKTYKTTAQTKEPSVDS